MEAAAQYERALRFAEGLDLPARATLHDGLAAEDELIDRWQQAAEARSAALALWRQAGDPVRIGDDLRLLSRAMWRLCRGKEAETTAVEALSVLGPLPPSGELAWAMANLAGVRTSNGDGASALALSRQAVEHAELLGDRALLSHALNTDACARIQAGQDGFEQLRRALDVALAAGREDQAGRAYANLHAALAADHRFAEAERVFADGSAYCAENDIATFEVCLRGERTRSLDKLGQWDQAVALCVSILDRRHLSPVNRLNPLIALGRIQSRRGDPAAAGSLAEAMELALGTGEAEYIVPATISLVEAAWLAGDPELAADHARSAVGPARGCDRWGQGMLAVWLRRCGIGDLDLPAALPRIAPPYGRQLAGDGVSAAAAWRALGCPYDEAMALLDSGQEADVRGALSLFDRLVRRHPSGWPKRPCAGSVSPPSRAVGAGPPAPTRSD